MPEKQYDHKQIEEKWFERWQDATFYEAEADSSRPKFYVREMLPYPSGKLHMGHVRVFTINDVIARYQRMQGKHVLRLAADPVTRSWPLPGGGQPTPFQGALPPAGGLTIAVKTVSAG